MRALALYTTIVLASSAQQPVLAKAQSCGIDCPYPKDVSLVKEGRLGFVYRHSESGKRLYTYDLDQNGRSVCVAACEALWPPVLAPSGATRLGRWSIVIRRDGSRQWAYQGKPIYTKAEDPTDRPSGDETNGHWHLLGYSATP